MARRLSRAGARPSPGDPGRRRARSRQPWPRAGPETAVWYLRSMTPMTADPEAPLTAARRWMITAAVMIVTVTQVLDTTVTNVALPHIQGALSAAVDEVSCVLTSDLAAGAVLFDPPYLRKPTRVDLPGLLLMAVGFLSLQLFLDQGERHEWFASSFVMALAVLAGASLLGFLLRELMTSDPIFDLSVYADRNFAAGSLIMLVLMIGFYSTMVLLALFTQKLLGYDAWTSGMVLAPGGVGNLLSLLIAGRLFMKVDQRVPRSLGCLRNAYATYSMATVTLGADYWALAWPRLVQGVGTGFIFVPLNTVALATISREKMSNATAALNVVRNLGGGIGVALLTTMLARRAQSHQSTLVGNVNVWDAETAERLP